MQCIQRVVDSTAVRPVERSEKNRNEVRSIRFIFFSSWKSILSLAPHRIYQFQTLYVLYYFSTIFFTFKTCSPDTQLV